MLGAIYARFSSQEGGLSCENQVSFLRAWFEEHGHQVAGVYVDDGYSGTTDNRPQLQKLLSDARDEASDFVAVRDGDRWARGEDITGYLNFTLQKLGISLISVLEIEDPQELRSFRAIMGGAYVRRIRQSVIATLREVNARNKRKIGGPGLEGYRWSEDKTTRLIVPEEAARIRELYRLVDEGRSQAELVRLFGIERERLRAILRHPAYAGDYVFCRKAKHPKTGRWVWQPPENWIIHRDAHEAIIPRDLWNRVQARLDEQAQKVTGRKKPPQARLALSGLLTCSDCGRNLRAVSSYVRVGDGKRRHLYRCRNESCRSRRSVYVCGATESLIERILEELQTEEFCRMLADGFARAHEDGRRQGDIEAEIRHLKGSAARLLDVIESGEVLDTREIIQRYNQVQRELGHWQATLAAEQKSSAITMSPAGIRRRLRSFCDHMELIAREPEFEVVARDFLHEIIEEIPMQPDGKTGVIKLRVPRILDLPESQLPPTSTSRLWQIAQIPWTIPDQRRRAA